MNNLVTEKDLKNQVPTNTPREGWSEQFAEMHKNGHDADLLEEPKLPKPVFVVRVPLGYTLENKCFEQEMQKLVETFEKSYFVILTIERDLTSIQFEMFSVHNASTVDFEQFQYEVRKNFESTIQGKESVLENGIVEGTCLGGFEK